MEILLLGRSIISRQRVRQVLESTRKAGLYFPTAPSYARTPTLTLPGDRGGTPNTQSYHLAADYVPFTTPGTVLPPGVFTKLWHGDIDFPNIPYIQLPYGTSTPFAGTQRKRMTPGQNVTMKLHVHAAVTDVSDDFLPRITILPLIVSHANVRSNTGIVSPGGTYRAMKATVDIRAFNPGSSPITGAKISINVMGHLVGALAEGAI